jgi:hypothetical protein
MGLLAKIGITLMVLGFPLWVALLNYAGSTPYHRRALTVHKYADRCLATAFTGFGLIWVAILIDVWAHG